MLAIIFDMDGVLLDSEPVQMHAFNKTLNKYGVSIGVDEFKTFIGIRTIDNFYTLKARYGLPGLPEAMVAEKNKNYQVLIAQEAKPRPGVVRLLNEAHDAAVPVAVASNSIREDVMLVLDTLGITSRFDVIVSGDEIINGKPDPEIFLKTRKHLSEKTGIAEALLECVVIEDNPFGVKAAGAAGMPVIAAPTELTRHMDFSDAALLVQSIENISCAVCKNLIANI